VLTTARLRLLLQHAAWLFASQYVCRNHVATALFAAAAAAAM
jgi:hypothetical protein